MVNFHPIQAFLDLTRDERIIMVGLMLKMGCLSIVYVALPLWFHSPKFLCLDENMNYISCSEEKACSDESRMIIDIKNSSGNIVTYFELYCSKAYMVSNCQSILILGSWLGCSFNVFIGITKNKRRKFFTIISTVYFLACFASLKASTPYHWAACISLCYFTYNSCYGNLIALLSENFAEEQKKYNFFFIWESYTVIGLLIAIIAYFTNSNWQVINFTYGLIMLFAYFALSKGRFQAEEIELNTNLPTVDTGGWDGFTEVWKNILVFVFVWIFNFTTNMGVSLELGNIGSVYFNVISYSILEGVCAFWGGYLVLQTHPINLMRVLVLVMVVFGLSFYFYNDSYSMIFSIMALSMKCVIELIYNILYIAVANYIPKRMITKFVGLAQFTSRIPGIFLPLFMNYSKSQLSIHPFFFIGCGYFITLNILRFTEKIEEIDHVTEVRVSFAHSDLVLYEEVDSSGRVQLLSDISQ